MALVDLKYPPSDADAAELRKWACELVAELGFILTHLDEENMAEQSYAVRSPRGETYRSGGEAEAI